MSAVCNNQEKMRLAMAVSQYGFALSDITLYLDTHPQDQEALEYYHHMKHKYKKVTEEYEARIAPLVQTGEGHDSCWQWAVTPWPWERGYY